MNALMYFGQQKIEAGVIDTNGQFTTTGNINNANDMNNITYEVKADPTAAGST